MTTATEHLTFTERGVKWDARLHIEKKTLSIRQAGSETGTRWVTRTFSSLPGAKRSATNLRSGRATTKQWLVVADRQKRLA